MMKKTMGRAPSLGRKLIAALAWAAGWTLAASMAVAWMLDREILRMEQTGYAAMIILLICGLLMAKKAGTGTDKIIGAFLGTGLYYFCLLTVNWLFFGGEFTGFAVTFVVLVIGTALGCIQPRKGRGGVSHTRYKIPKV